MAARSCMSSELINTWLLTIMLNFEGYSFPHCHTQREHTQKGWAPRLSRRLWCCPRGRQMGLFLPEQDPGSWPSDVGLGLATHLPRGAEWTAASNVESLLDKKADLDRAWMSPMTLQPHRFSSNASGPIHNQSLITLWSCFGSRIRLPDWDTREHVGPWSRRQPPKGQGCRVNLRKFRKSEILKEWTRLMQLSLTAPMAS